MTHWHRFAYVIISVLTLATVLLVMRGLTMRVNDAETSVVELSDQVRGLGGVPVAGPPGEVGTAGQQGEQGPGPTLAQVQSAVALYCAGGACRGTSGADGDAPSPSQVAVAVSTYCNANGECRGSSGADGRDGVDGKDATPPSDAQVANAVAAYCTGDKCRGGPGADGKDGKDGAPGADGTNGAPGADGRGVTTVDCTSLTPTTFTFTYSDGTTQEVSCGAVGRGDN